MGTINHNAIIATTWDDGTAEAFRVWLANTLSTTQFVTTPKTVNSYQSFFFPPDGSKEGWEDSATGDGVRDLIVARLREDDYEDGSSPWEWVEVGFGEYGQAVIDGNCKNCYNDAPYAVPIVPRVQNAKETSV